MLAGDNHTGCETIEVLKNSAYRTVDVTSTTVILSCTVGKINKEVDDSFSIKTINTKGKNS
jgi:hypothetical protein